MKYTGNLKLLKPDGSDVYDIDHMNQNADILDKEINTIKNKSVSWDKATSNILILENVAILSTSWKEENDEYVYTIPFEKSNNSYFPIFAPHKNFIEKAKLIYSIETKDGEITLYSTLKPLNDVTGNITLIKEVI